MATINVVTSDDPEKARAVIQVPYDFAAAFYSATNKADGVLPNTGYLDSGQSYVVTGNAADPYYIENNGLQTDTTLAYLNFGPLPSDIHTYDMDVRWIDEGEADDQTAVMIIADGPFANDFPVYANSGAHVILNRDVLTYQKRGADGTDTTTLLTHIYEAPLAFDVIHRFKLMWDGVTVRIITPEDVELEIGPDSQVSEWWGPYGCTELLGGAGLNRVQVLSFSAGADPAAATPAIAPYRMLGAGQSDEATSQTDITTSLSSNLFQINFTIPESRRIWVTGHAFMYQNILQEPAISQLGIGAYVGGVTQHGYLTTVVSGYTPANASVDAQLFADRQDDQSTYNTGGLVPFAFDITLSPAFQIGSVQFIALRMMANADGLWSFVHSGSDGGFSGIRRSSMQVFSLPVAND